MPDSDDSLFFDQKNYPDNIVELFPELGDMYFSASFEDDNKAKESLCHAVSKDLQTETILNNDPQVSSLPLDKSSVLKQDSTDQFLEMLKSNIELTLEKLNCELQAAKAAKEQFSTPKKGNNAYRRCRDEVTKLMKRIELKKKHLLLIELKFENDNKVNNNSKWKYKKEIAEFKTKTLAKEKLKLEKIRMDIFSKEQEIGRLEAAGQVSKDSQRAAIWQKKYRLIQKMETLEANVNILEELSKINASKVPNVQVNLNQMRISPIRLKSNHETSKRKRTTQWQSQMQTVISALNEQQQDSSIAVDENFTWLPGFNNKKEAEEFLYDRMEECEVDEVVATKRIRLE